MKIKLKRRYKLLLIILIGGAITFLINTTSVKSKIDLVSIGDGLSLGMTPYNVAGNSFNDYIKEYLIRGELSPSQGRTLLSLETEEERKKYLDKLLVKEVNIRDVEYLEKKNKLGSFNNEFSEGHLRIHELNDYLEDNTLGRFTRLPIKQILAKADVITIAIGIDELADISLYEEISTKIIEDYLREMENLLKIIREFYDKEIVVISLYPAYNFERKDAIEINRGLSKIAAKYNSKYLDIIAYSLNESYFLDKTSYYMNYLAHEHIANEIINMLFE